MESVLLFYYEVEEKYEYPDPNSLGRIVWYEIDYAEFVEYTKNPDGTYGCDRVGGRDIKTFDELCDMQYSYYKETLSNEANQFEGYEEQEYLYNELKEIDFNTKENRAWIDFWVLYHNARWMKEHEQRKAAREAEEQSVRPS